MSGFSLLWPADYDGDRSKTSLGLGKDCIRDLGLENTIEALGVSEEHREAIRQILFSLCTELQVIRYRQDILDDLIRCPSLRACLKDLLPDITTLYSYEEKRRTAEKWELTSLFQVLIRLNELKVYADCVTKLSSAFEKNGRDLRSEGLVNLRDHVAAVEQDPVFRHMAKELPRLLTEVQTHASVTIGVNLNSELRPVEATLLSVNRKKFTSSKLVATLFGEAFESGGIAGFYKLDNKGEVMIEKANNRVVKYDQPTDPLLIPLFRDLEKILSKTSKSISHALEQYLEVKTDLLVNLRQEVVFYIASVEMIEEMRACGLPLCRPELLPPEERLCEIKNNFNLNLALHLLNGEGSENLPGAVVQNNVSFGSQARTIILTGPNQGGKTTYIQAVGLTQVLAQAGMYVPGEEAHISPVDNILTHYPIEESLEKATGRFGDEAKRLDEIFKVATRCSLILLNESLCSTSPGESLYLAQDIVRVLLKMGVRAIFVTHLHELAARLEELNSDKTCENQAISMVASYVAGDHSGNPDQPVKRTYKVAFGPPMGHSCAKEIAARYNVSYEQLIEMLEKRGVLKDGNGG